jgi:enoyl-CoA hydratase/carnithine racemase
MKASTWADTRFRQMEARRGIAPLGGAHFRYITRAGWGNAMYHLMLCDEFGAEEAYRIGLAQEVTPVGRQVERAIEIARLIAANAPPWRPGDQGSRTPVHRGGRARGRRSHTGDP